MFRAVVLVITLVVIGFSGNLAAPAWACGCGAYIPDVTGPAVVDERALVAWDGHDEDVLMSFDVTGSSQKAAWIMPVPSAATVTLGDRAVFDELANVSAPRVEYHDSWWPTFGWLNFGAAPDRVGAAAPGGVDVLARQRLGPFDVARLTSDNAAALAGWLTEHGFPHPQGLDRNLAPYVADGWEIIAVQLVNDSVGRSLTGDLQPLHLRFASERAVYPMRLSRSASTPQNVDLYVLGAHRMDPSAVPVADAAPELEFAGRVPDDRVAPALRPFVAPFADSGAFLTHWTNHLDTPADITGDYAFTAAPADTEYQQVITRERNRGDLTGAILLLSIPLAIVVATIGSTLWFARRRPARGA